MRASVKEDVLPAGKALNELKRRVGHGGWEDWLKSNFDGSEETATLYMRVAARWDEVVAEGLDRDGVTLEEIRRFLAKDRPRAGPAAKAAGGSGAGHGCAAGTPADKDHPVTLKVPAAEYEDFLARLGRVAERFGTVGDQGATVLAALEFCDPQRDQHNDPGVANNEDH
jgi:hypothetical protein